jgi:hypothetical protein
MNGLVTVHGALREPGQAKRSPKDCRAQNQDAAFL